MLDFSCLRATCIMMMMAMVVCVPVRVCKVKVEVAQSCPTLRDPMDDTVRGILQARILEWVAFAFSRDLPNPGIKPRPPASQADSLPAEPPRKPLCLRVFVFSFISWLFGLFSKKKKPQKEKSERNKKRCSFILLN